MGKIVLDNCYRVGGCPFCGSPRVVPAGLIQYREPVVFATHEVILRRTPELWRCKRCLSGYVENAIPPLQAVALYEQGDSTSRWEAHSFETDKTEQLVEFVSGLIDSDVNVLDFGCNDGTMLDYVRARGCRTFGVEASAKARSVAEVKGHIVKPTLDAFPKEVVFDVVCAMDVVEHLYDIPRFLAQIAPRLAVGGVLVLLTGNINSLMARMAKNNWWYIRYPEHVRFPSLRWWRRYSGYRLVKTARVHASRGYVHPPTVGSVKNALERWMRNEYDGMPVLLPDHYVVALTLKRSVGIPR